MMLMFVPFIFAIRTVTATYVNGEQEEWSSKISTGSQPQAAYYQQQTQRASGLCAANTQCVPLTSCPILANIMNHACINSNTVGSLGCGYPGSSLVCCPSGSSYSNTWYTPRYPVPGALGNKDDNQCGRSVVQGENYNGIGAYPWVVRVAFRNSLTGDVKYPCAGSILSRRIILTAAHCALAKADNYKLHAVRVGEWRTDSTLDCGEEFCALPIQDIALSHVIVHPGYVQKTFKDDVALLVLRADINYTVTAQPICLLDNWSQPSNQALLVGWGRAAGQQVQSPLQQIIKLPVVRLQQCVNVYSRLIPITENHLCAGGQYGNDACEGFGGAPLLVKHNDIYYQIGILSFGSNQCGAAGVPSVYTSIKKYSQWIKDNTPVLYT